MMNNLCMLHFIPSMQAGGAEQQLVKLADELAKNSVDIHIAYCRDGRNSEQAEQSGAKIHKLSDLHFYDPRLGRQIRKCIETVNPDVVCTWLEPMDIAAGRQACKLGVPWIVFERSRGPFVIDTSFRAKIRKSWRMRQAQKAAAIFCNSKPAQQAWSQTVNTPCFVVPNIVDCGEFESSVPIDLKQWNIPNDRAVIVMAGRLERPKNYLFALEALKDVDADIFILGRGSMENAIQKKIYALNISSKVHLVGFQEDLAGWLKRANLFVSTSIYEGLPNVVLAAISCGKSMVISDIPAHDQFRQDGVYLAGLDNADSFAQVVIRALEEKKTPDIKSLERFSPQRVAIEYLELFKKIVNQANPCR